MTSDPEGSRKVSVLLADDHPVVLSALKGLLATDLDLTFAGEARNGDEAVRLCEETRADIAVLDLSMPSGGIDLVKRFAATFPNTRILVVTMHRNSDYCREALRSGAHGYAVKSLDITDLLRAVHLVAEGGVYVDPQLAPDLVPNGSEPAAEATAADPWEQLSPRQREVILCVGQGYTNRVIAEKLNISTKSIETHRLRAMLALGLDSRVELIAYLVKRGLLK